MADPSPAVAFGVPIRDVTIWHLVLPSPEGFRPRRSDTPGLAFVRVPEPIPELNRFLYTAVGGAYHWVDRLPWDRDTWLRRLRQPELETWLLTQDGVPAGYCELERLADGRIEIAIFGLLPWAVGRGLGAHLLTCAVERAWAMGTPAVYLNTCSLDHPRARANYEARGFVLERVETIAKSLSDAPPGPWPGA